MTELVWFRMELMERISDWNNSHEILDYYHKRRQAHLDDHFRNVRCIHTECINPVMGDHGVVNLVLIYELDMSEYLRAKLTIPLLEKHVYDGVMDHIASLIFVRYSIESEWTQWR